MTEKKFVVTEAAMRPANPDGRCFYCRQKIGDYHLSSCVLIRKKAVVRATVEYEIEVPYEWNEEMLMFSRHESSWCQSNFIDELEELESQDGKQCLCGRVEFELKEFKEEPFLKE